MSELLAVCWSKSIMCVRLAEFTFLVLCYDVYSVCCVSKRRTTVNSVVNCCTPGVFIQTCTILCLKVHFC